MPKRITFPNKEEAAEYAKAMKSRGWDTLLQHDPATSTWVVHISLVKEGVVISEQKVPTSVGGILAAEEAEMGAGAAWAPRQFKRLGRGAKETGKGMLRAADETVIAAASGRSLEPSLRTMSKRIDVVGGMKRAIPTVGGGRRGYLAKIGEMGAARITEGAGEPRPSIAEGGGMPRPAIAKIPEPGIKSLGRPSIASSSSVTLGVSRDIRFQTVPKGMRFQVPKSRRLSLTPEKAPARTALEETTTTEEKGG